MTMKNIDALKQTKLDRIITIRFTANDYETLKRMGQGKGASISEVIRAIMHPVVALTEKNNLKS